MMMFLFQLRGVIFEGCLSPLICKGCIEKAKDDSPGKIKCVFLRHQNHTYKIMRIVGSYSIGRSHLSFCFFLNDLSGILTDVVVEP